jgi:hypothetical protein
MKRSVQAAVLAAFLLSAFSVPFGFSAAAEAGNACRSAAYFTQRLSAAERVTAHLQGPEALRFMELYNAVPPVTQLQADEVLVLSKAGVANVVVLRFVGGCFRDYGIHPAGLAELLLRRSVGQAL